MLESTLKVFKRSCRDKNRSLRICAIGMLFRLLDQFAGAKNNQAPVLYKILTFSLVENHADEVTREYMMQNFIDLFQSHATIPVGILIDPLLKIIQTAERQTYNYNVFDFEFFTSLAKHPKLQASPHGLQLMD